MRYHQQTASQDNNTRTVDRAACTSDHLRVRPGPCWNVRVHDRIFTMHGVGLGVYTRDFTQPQRVTGTFLPPG